MDPDPTALNKCITICGVLKLTKLLKKKKLQKIPWRLDLDIFGSMDPHLYFAGYVSAFFESGSEFSLCESFTLFLSKIMTDPISNKTSDPNPFVKTKIQHFKQTIMRNNWQLAKAY